MSNYKDIIKKGREEEKSEQPKEQKKQKAVNTVSGKTVKNDGGNDPVNITIKVPRKSRQYWTSQCKLEGLTMTEVLVEALENKFGKP